MTCWAVVGDGSARRSFSSLSLLVVPCLWCACGADRVRPICLLGVFFSANSRQSIKALATIAGEQDSERASYYSIPGARVFWQQGLPDGDHDGA